MGLRGSALAAAVPRPKEQAALSTALPACLDSTRPYSWSRARVIASRRADSNRATLMPSISAQVLELFITGAPVHSSGVEKLPYLEIEWGPAGHFLALKLLGARGLHDEMPHADLQYQCTCSGGIWRGTLEIPSRYIPPGPHTYNFYWIHGVGAERRYLSAVPVSGSQPDFHRLEFFAQLPVPLPCAPSVDAWLEQS